VATSPPPTIWCRIAWNGRFASAISGSPAGACGLARREVTTPDAGASLTEFPAQEAHVQCHDVLAVVDELPPEQRDALLLMALEGPSYREAARIFEINVGTLRSRLARARETVRQRCGREPSADERRLRRVK
jgi:RNA polymerase sigma-70 factor (ECF subfamily)